MFLFVCLPGGLVVLWMVPEPGPLQSVYPLSGWVLLPG